MIPRWWHNYPVRDHQEEAHINVALRIINQNTWGYYIVQVGWIHKRTHAKP
jgi:hypothetical protein